MAITNATNATPIVITSSAHGFSTDDYVQIVGILGNLAANGIWQIIAINANSFSLNDSVGEDDYVSGGTAYKITADPETTWADDVDIQETTTTAGTGTVTLGGPIALKFPYGILEDGAVVEYLIEGAEIEPTTEFALAASCQEATLLTVNTPVSVTIVNGDSGASDAWVKMPLVIGQDYTITITTERPFYVLPWQGTECADAIQLPGLGLPGLGNLGVTPTDFSFEAENTLLLITFGFSSGVTTFTIEVSA